MVWGMLVVMVEEVSIAGLRAKKAAKQTRVLAGVQSVVIFLLLVMVAAEYDHNEYLQAWAGMHLGGFGFLLNGTLAAFYAGVLIAVHLNRPVPVVAGRVRRREEIPVAPEAR
ncbi:hypothetical protein E6H31_04670 [Candidatus Bathyarchaeota archaeon]|nr:MAG: hypothetical protein E6H31_04670 [Candidatus Bathyarchaeota archaeon]